MRSKFKMLAVAGALTAFSPASAAIFIYDSPGPIQPSENVMLPQGQDALTITGVTNGTHQVVKFVSNNLENLITPANGQARITTADGSLDGLSFSLANPRGKFQEVEFNLFDAVRGTRNVTLQFNGGNTYVHQIGDGQNYFAAKATGTDFLTSVSFDTDGAGVKDIRQIRLGGISVPEPASWAMMLAGFGLVGGAMRRRSSMKVTLA